MAKRITLSMLNRSLEAFCKLTGLPSDDGKMKPNTLYVSGAYDGWRVEQISPTGNGSSPVWSHAFGPALSVYNEIETARRTLSILPAAYLRKRAEEVEKEDARRSANSTVNFCNLTDATRD